MTKESIMTPRWTTDARVIAPDTPLHDADTVAALLHWYAESGPCFVLPLVDPCFLTDNTITNDELKEAH